MKNNKINKKRRLWKKNVEDGDENEKKKIILIEENEVKR